jgi:hypothetical protein
MLFLMKRTDSSSAPAPQAPRRLSVRFRSSITYHIAIRLGLQHGNKLAVSRLQCGLLSPGLDVPTANPTLAYSMLEPAAKTSRFGVYFYDYNIKIHTTKQIMNKYLQL